MYNMMPV